jgi:hypothetical protein
MGTKKDKNLERFLRESDRQYHNEVSALHRKVAAIKQEYIKKYGKPVRHNPAE